MLAFSSWIYVDTLIMLIQLSLCALFYRKMKPSLGMTNTLGLIIAAYLFIVPIGLFPVALTWLSQREAVPRDLFWHFKLGAGLSLNDIILMGYTALILIASKRYFLKKSFVSFVGLFILLYIIGLLSVINAPLGIDPKLILNSTRTVLLFVTGILLAYRLAQRHYPQWVKEFLLFLVVINVLSMVSMVLLEYDAKGVRYWTSSIIESQGATTVSIILLVYLMYSDMFAQKSWKYKLLLYFFPLTIAIGGGVKGVIFAFILLLLGKFLLAIPYIKTLTRTAVKIRIVTLILALALPSSIIGINYALFGIGAIDTRLFQVLNSMQTLYDQGFSSLMFGIGWKQWYFEIYEFPFIDYGAWTEEEILMDGAKNSIQIIPFSIIRSVGIVGLFVMLAMILRVQSYVSQETTSLKENMTNFYLVFFLASEFLTIPDTLPEVAMFASIMLFGLLSQAKQARPQGVL